jgi:hypothetical protein
MREKMSYRDKQFLKLSEPLFKKRVTEDGGRFTERGEPYKNKKRIIDITFVFRMRSDGALICSPENIGGNPTSNYLLKTGEYVFKFRNNMKMYIKNAVSYRTLKIRDKDGLSIFLKGIDLGWSANRDLLFEIPFLNAFEVKMLRALRDSWKIKINKGDYSGFD